MKDGYALPSQQPGLGIDWDWKAIERKRNGQPIVLSAGSGPKPAKSAGTTAAKH
jgi:hypothetical protein